MSEREQKRNHNKKNRQKQSKFDDILELKKEKFVKLKAQKDDEVEIDDQIRSYLRRN